MFPCRIFVRKISALGRQNGGGTAFFAKRGPENVRTGARFLFFDAECLDGRPVMQAPRFFRDGNGNLCFSSEEKPHPLWIVPA